MRDTDRQTETDRQTDRHRHRQTDRHRQTHGQRKTDTQTHRQADRDRQTDKEREREIEIDRQRQRQREEEQRAPPMSTKPSSASLSKLSATRLRLSGTRPLPRPGWPDPEQGLWHVLRLWWCRENTTFVERSLLGWGGLLFRWTAFGVGSRSCSRPGHRM